jgi:Zn-dependent M28 family amino/carboxypeptidase
VLGSASHNVIATKPGTSATTDLVLVTVHLDSINGEHGAAAPAPGANDNGSGSAGALEIARALQDHSGLHDLEFVLFGGEEQRLHGSRQYVAALDAATRARIRAVVNTDMIASLNTPPPPLAVTPTVLLEGAIVSQAVIDGLAEAATTYTGLRVQTSLNPHDSDHGSFIDADIPAVLTIEGADAANEHVHTARDTLDRIDFALALEVLRMNTAFVATSVGSA